MTTRSISSSNFDAFINEREVAVILFDAKWDIGGRKAIRPLYFRAESELGDKVNFGEVDCDREGALAKTARIVNVPTVGYYRFGQCIAVLIGSRQDVLRRTQRVLAGLHIGRDDGFGTCVEKESWQ